MIPDSGATRLPLDERTLTVNLALAAWTAITAVAITRLVGLDGAGLAGQSGLWWIAALGLTALALGAVFLAADSPSAKRLQLGVVLSLIAHTGVLIGLALADLRVMDLAADAAPVKVEQPLPEAPPELITVDRQDVAPKPDFERPLTTGAPQRQTTPTTERQAPKLPDTMLLPADAPRPDAPAFDAPALARPQPAAVRADVQPGQRSRNVAASASLAPAPAAPELSVADPAEPNPPIPRAPRRLAMSEPRPRPLIAPEAAVAPRVSRAAATDSGLQPANRQNMVRPTLPSPARSNLAQGRPRVLAKLGPAPLEAPSATMAPLQNPSNQDTAATAVRTPSLDRSRGPSVVGLPAPPLPGRPAAPAPVAAPMAALPRARPQPLAAPPAADLLADAGRRGRATPLASLGVDGQALTAPPDLLARAEATPGRQTMIQATPGKGGLGSKPADAAGLARAESSRPAASLAPGRAQRTPSGGAPNVAGDQRQPAAAFSNRGDRTENLASGSEGSPSARTEAAIELGLKFLVGTQQPDGSWAFGSVGADAGRVEGSAAPIEANAAATGLALLAFLGAGYDHIDGAYQTQVGRGIDYLLSVQGEDGLLFPEGRRAGAYQVARFYSHGIASIALCEAYGMTGDPRLQRPAQRALDYITRTQVGRLGGWRYMPGINADLSVTGWQLMALRSGELAGLSVPSRTYAGVRQFLEACRDPDNDQARFCYNPNAPADDPRTRHGRNPGTVMTSVGMLMQLYLGEGRESERMQRGADFLADRLPTTGDTRQPAATSTAGNPLRDTYYWYYGTQVMFHMGGRHWRQWNEALHPLLVDAQTTTGPMTGSWNPVHPTPDKWWHLGGRLYVTAMNLLSLEVYYRHLPLYEMTSR